MTKKGRVHITKHAQHRYARRILGVRDVDRFLRKKKNYQRVIGSILRMYHQSEYIGTGDLSRQHKRNSKYYMNGHYMLVVDADSGNLITLYPINSLENGWY